MAIPSFQELLWPLLQQHRDGAEHAIADLRAALADELAFSEEELAETLPSGRQGKFANRLAWAASHLRAAGLLESAGRGRTRLTERGRQLLAEERPGLSCKDLERFAEYRAFRRLTRSDAPPEGGDGRETATMPEAAAELTPRECIELAYRELRAALAAELIERIKAAPPAFFEQLIVDLMLRLGYGGAHEKAARVVGKSGDGGIDGILDEDRLGLDNVYLQAKRWENDVGRPEVQKFVGALAGQGASKGVFVTTSGFTREARDYAGQLSVKLALIDGPTLAGLMIDHGLGVTLRARFDLYEVDSDYFASE